MFKIRSVAVSVAVLIAAVAVAFSGGGRAAQPDSLRPAAHLHEKVPPQIRAMLARVSARRIEHTVKTLVSFHNRNTLSPQTNPTPGSARRATGCSGRSRRRRRDRAAG
jgi:hypothetical protein